MDPVLINGKLTKPLRTEAQARAVRSPVEYWINVWLDKAGDPVSETVFTVETEALDDITSTKAGWSYLHTIVVSAAFPTMGSAHSRVVNLREEADVFERWRKLDAAIEQQAIRKEMRAWEQSR